MLTMKLPMRTYYDRYVAGECDKVWNELRLLGDVAPDHQAYQDACAVADEAMRRTRANLELIVARLNEEGYQFFDTCDPPTASGVPLMTPDEDSRSLIATLERMVGPLPIVLRSWISIVGDVSLLGQHPKWPDVTDAMLVEFEGRHYRRRVPHEQRIQKRLNDWKFRKSMGIVKPFVLYFAPDVYHKVGYSGGSGYGINLPASTVDGSVDLGESYLTFIDYVRLCFNWGGFPGFEDLPEGSDVGIIHRLTMDLLPI